MSDNNTDIPSAADIINMGTEHMMEYLVNQERFAELFKNIDKAGQKLGAGAKGMDNDTVFIGAFLMGWECREKWSKQNDN